MTQLDLLIRAGRVVTEAGEAMVDVGVAGGKIVALGELATVSATTVLNARGLVIMPGLVDPHVHFREPGPEEEEDFATGTRAAAAGGVTTVLEQPVDTPPTTTVDRFHQKLERVRSRSYVDFGLWAGLVPDNLGQLTELVAAGATAFKAFICSSDPVYPMVDDGILLQAMIHLATLDQLLAIHCENQAIIEAYSSRLAEAEHVEPIDHARSRPKIAELEAIQRVIILAGSAGVRLHILHLSVANGAELVAAARVRGQRVTVETCPHYLVLTEQALNKYGPYAKCNPPLRDEENQRALWSALRCGKIDCLVSDHSPYTSIAKARGENDIRLAPSGISDLEYGLPLMLHAGINEGRLSLTSLARLMATNPARLFNLYPRKGHIAVGADADLVLVDPDSEWTIDVSRSQKKNKWSPFDGWKIRGRVVRTIVRGSTVYIEGEFPAGPGFGRCSFPPPPVTNEKRNTQQKEG